MNTRDLVSYALGVQESFLQKNLKQSLSNEENQSIPLAQLQTRHTHDGETPFYSSESPAQAYLWHNNFQVFKAAEMHRDIYSQRKDPRDILASFEEVSTAIEGVKDQAFSSSRLQTLQHCWHTYTQDMSQYETSLNHMKTTCHQTLTEGIQALTQTIQEYYGHARGAAQASWGSLKHAEATTFQGAALKQLQAFLPIQAFSHDGTGDNLYLIHAKGAVHLTPEDQWEVTAYATHLQVTHNGLALPLLQGGIMPQIMTTYTQELSQDLQNIQTVAFSLKEAIDQFFSSQCTAPVTQRTSPLFLPQNDTNITGQGVLTLGYKKNDETQWTYQDIDLTGVTTLTGLAQKLSIPQVLQGTWTLDGSSATGTFALESTTHQWVYGGGGQVTHDGVLWSLPHFLRWQTSHPFLQNVRDERTYWQDVHAWKTQGHAPDHSVTTLGQYAFPSTALKHHAEQHATYPLQDGDWTALHHTIETLKHRVVTPWVHAQENQRLAVEHTFKGAEHRMKQVHEQYLNQVHESSDTWNESLLDLLDQKEVLHTHHQIHQRMRQNHRNSLKG